MWRVDIAWRFSLVEGYTPLALTSRLPRNAFLAQAEFSFRSSSVITRTVMAGLFAFIKLQLSRKNGWSKTSALSSGVAKLKWAYLNFTSFVSGSRENVIVDQRTLRSVRIPVNDKVCHSRTCDHSYYSAQIFRVGPSIYVSSEN